MPRTCATPPRGGTPRLQELPIFQRTTCRRCRADQGVAVRCRDTVLCLDCYRRAKRAARARWRRLGALARGAAAGDADVVVGRLARRTAGAGEGPRAMTSPARSESTGEVRSPHMAGTG